jgi:hypothetical protein
MVGCDARRHIGRMERARAADPLLAEPGTSARSRPRPSRPARRRDDRERVAARHERRRPTPNTLLEKLRSGADLASLLRGATGSTAAGYGASATAAATVTGGLALDRYA